jgi:hypothetical protein
MVRASLAAYNTIEDLDALVETLSRITEDRYHGAYRQVPQSGDYVPDTPITVLGPLACHPEPSAVLPSSARL